VIKCRRCASTCTTVARQNSTNLSSSPSLTRFRPRKSAARIREAMKPRAESTDPRSAVKITSTRRARIIFGGGGGRGRDESRNIRQSASPGISVFPFPADSDQPSKRGRAGSTPPFMSAHTRPTYSHVKSKREGEGRRERGRGRERGREGERDKSERGWMCRARRRAHTVSRTYGSIAPLISTLN